MSYLLMTRHFNYCPNIHFTVTCSTLYYPQSNCLEHIPLSCKKRFAVKTYMVLCFHTYVFRSSEKPLTLYMLSLSGPWWRYALYRIPSKSNSREIFWCWSFTANLIKNTLTLKVLYFWKFTSYCSLKPLWSGMGEVVPALTSPTLHPPSPPTVHQLSRLAL